MQNELEQIDKLEPELLRKSACSVDCINNYWNGIATELKGFSFKYPADEYYYFKFLKPFIHSQLQYHAELYYIHSRKPSACKKTIRKYYKACLKENTLHEERNALMYQYYKSGNTEYDDKYFSRKARIKFDEEGKLLKNSNETTTAYDLLFARIMANELLQPYLEKEIMKLGKTTEVSAESLQYNPEQAALFNSNLSWTASKADLVEMIYGLYAAKVFKNGEADIKEIATFFEKAFNVDLGDYYRTYTQILNRKKNNAKFLESMKESLITKIEEDQAAL